MRLPLTPSSGKNEVPEDIPVSSRHGPVTNEDGKVWGSVPVDVNIFQVRGERNIDRPAPSLTAPRSS